jgi:hypothetical protein
MRLEVFRALLLLYPLQSNLLGKQNEERDVAKGDLTDSRLAYHVRKSQQM